jgi:hypothetical protein
MASCNRFVRKLNEAVDDNGRRTMAYWLDARCEEWGFIGGVEPLGLRVRDSRPDPNEVQVWVEHLMELVEGRKATRVVEDRAEFEYLYRCLEKIGKTFAFSPILPRAGNFENQQLIQAA